MDLSLASVVSQTDLLKILSKSGLKSGQGPYHTSALLLVSAVRLCSFHTLINKGNIIVHKVWVFIVTEMPVTFQHF